MRAKRCKDCGPLSERFHTIYNVFTSDQNQLQGSLIGLFISTIPIFHHTIHVRPYFSFLIRIRSAALPSFPIRPTSSTLTQRWRHARNAINNCGGFDSNQRQAKHTHDTKEIHSPPQQIRFLPLGALQEEPLRTATRRSVEPIVGRELRGAAGVRQAASRSLHQAHGWLVHEAGLGQAAVVLQPAHAVHQRRLGAQLADLVAGLRHVAETHQVRLLSDATHKSAYTRSLDSIIASILGVGVWGHH